MNRSSERAASDILANHISMRPAVFRRSAKLSAHWAVGSRRRAGGLLAFRPIDMLIRQAVRRSIRRSIDSEIHRSIAQSARRSAKALAHRNSRPTHPPENRCPKLLVWCFRTVRPRRPSKLLELVWRMGPADSPEASPKASCPQKPCIVMQNVLPETSRECTLLAAFWTLAPIILPRCFLSDVHGHTLSG